MFALSFKDCSELLSLLISAYLNPTYDEYSTYSTEFNHRGFFR